jgi:RNA polymerase sigma factor (sigma-70 family)
LSSSEQELIERCRKKDPRAEIELYKKYYPLVSSIGKRYFLNYDDMKFELNYAFYKVLENIGKYDSKFAFATWVRRISVNHFIDVLRRKKRKLEEFPIDPTQMYEAVWVDDLGWEEDFLRHLLKQLPETTANAFNLFAIDGYKHKEIAALLEITETASKWHVNSARNKLKDLLKINKAKKEKRFLL